MIIALFSTCNKYPDGPNVSLVPKKSRLAGKWKLDKFYINDVDETKLFSVFFMTIKLKGEYNFYFTSPISSSYCEDGTWELTDKKQDLTFNFNAGDQANGFGCGPQEKGSYVYEIRRLKQNELWLRRVLTSGEVVDFHFKPKRN